ncbi:MAG: metallophosphoesterase [Rhodovarius sp.]|nr:metallophosphoesterase [Rhodovarius sp.]MCX7931740.1 metallophosphoesterase [Rhodovarius sp.]MDW8313972.1 metallophosphoesterase [Rhodovarius sp.]
MSRALPDPLRLRERGFRGLRVVGDVHGDARGFEAAAAGAEAEGLFLLQLGDLTDGGSDAPAVLRRMFGLLDRGRGLFLLGNHDHKLRRALLGARLRGPLEGLEATLAQLDAAPDGEALKARVIAEVARAPAWLKRGQALFVHAAFHPDMLLHDPPPDAGERRPEPPVTRALYGQVARGVRADGYPERLIHWVDHIPAGLTVYCGHDSRSRDGRPLRLRGRSGGDAVFLDTGAGKGGHLSWIDLPV